ncbi:helicase ARIP4-like isoform X2 [Physella acuta]|uniref:helicase ARIP4-like isoform X2 n=1 Tax=Physella acuta TaxID=109671 RepID=UPI0027DB94A3|nr:helicase ARIP4-like isoform X2 [Physella acuta]
MEEVTDLVDPVTGTTEALATDIMPDSLESFLSEQKEKPRELKMIESDILELANTVGEEMEENSVDEASLATDLAFLASAEAKETTGDEDDPGLSFLVGEGKIDVNNDDLAFLEEQDLSEGSYTEEEDENTEYESEETEEEEEGEEEENEDNDATEGEDNTEEDEKKNDMEEDGVFGQVSFYDEESASSNSLDVGKQKQKKIDKKAKKSKGKKRKMSFPDKGRKKARKKRKLKRKKSKNDDDDDDEPDDKLLKSGTTLMRRKNIRSILKEKDLDKDMLSAQNEELERQKRLMELKKSLLRENAAAGAAAAAAKAAAAAASSAAASASTSVKTATASTGTSTPKEKDSQLKSLLQVAEEEAEKEAESKERKLLDKEVVKVKKETRETSPPSDVITLSSESEDSDDYDEDDSDEVVMVPSDEGEEDDEDPEDVNNGGAHIDDALNLPDPDGRVKVNIGHPPDDPDIYLAAQIAQAIKPHQIGGVRFLYDNMVESLERFRTTPGFGCILAHSMGLGKTIQLISFIDIFLRCTGGKLVLCIVPINTLQNWLAEFNYWLPPKEKLHPDDNLTQSRTFQIYIINDSLKTTAARASVVGKWKETGGVLLMGYEMFRLLSSKKVAPSKAKSRSKKPVKPEVIDVEEEDKNKTLMIDMHGVLVDPGPDLVVCDEGHRIKNSSAAISQSLKNIKTRRRVVLTGYPLQNNLMEYWCMVDFVRPNFLGTKTEFSNMFERPIMNGQCMDSTNSDKKIMRHRSYVLHNLLEGFVQRRGHTVLQLSLPPKTEHVFLVRLSPIQHKIYCEFMNAISESGLCSWANNNPLKAFAVCCKIWNHPDILYDVLTQHIADKDNDLDIDTGEGGTNKKKKVPGLTKAASTLSLSSVDSAATSTLTPSASTASLGSMASEGGNDKNPIVYDWAEPLMKDYVAGLLENSGKFMIMNSIVEECLAVGDKVLIFSQSLLTLNKIEEFMGKLKVPRPEIMENWQRNKTYFRLDGSTSAQDREKLINQFNDPESNIWVFLLSTKAGCLGINLVAANRVIVVDASWNPCHDCQAICRVYRFGQMKNSYVYRLITENTLEKRIYDRQINKQGMSDRIIDDMNPENKLTRRQVENLLDFEDQEYPLVDFSTASTKYSHDTVLVNVLEKHGKWLTKQPFTHESLLIDRKELRLSKREKRLAKEGYARDKRMNVTYTRPTYAAYYPQPGGLPSRLPLNSRYNYAAFRRGPIVRPIASVRPMIAANVQNGGEKIKQFGGQPLRPGVTIHQVITTTDIVLPGTNTGTQAGASVNNKIGAGEKILVIKTPKGVYIRTNDGKMFAVRSKTGAGLTDIGGTSGVTTTTATTTFTSAGGNQVFITPSMNIGAGGKKPPIIIVSNKKGMPITMTRGGSIIRTLPYGTTNILNSLKPSILRTGINKSGDSTVLTASNAIKSSASTSTGEKVTSLADLIASEDEDSKGSGEKKMSDGSTQAEESPPKRPVIVLPSLAVRTPRPLSSIQSSTIATTSPGGGTVVIMPTKPVVSMGTKRAPKNPRPRKKATSKDSPSPSTVEEIRVGPTTKQKGVSLLSNMSVASTTSTPSASASGTITSASTATSPSSAAASNPIPSTTTQAQTPTSSGPPVQTTPESQPKAPAHSSAFPDLNSMWQSNFGASSSQNPPSAPVSTNSYSGGMMMPNSTPAPMSAGQENSNIDSSSNSSNQNIMTGSNQIGNFNSSHNTTNQGYNSMNNPYMTSNMSPYGMGPPPSMIGQGLGSMQHHMPPYMHSGFMPSPPGSFSQSLPPPPSDPVSNPSHQGSMYGSSNSQFSSFGHSQQNPPPFGASGSNFQVPSNSTPFGFGSEMSGMNYGAPPTTSSSFMSQSQGEQNYPPAPNFHQNTSPAFGMDGPSESFPSQSSSHTSTTPNYQDSGLSAIGRNSRDNSPFSLTLLGSESNTPGHSKSSKPSSQRPKTSSSSSKKSKVIPPVSSGTSSPNVNKPQSNPNKPRGSSNKTPSPAPSPRHTTHTPENSKSFMDLSNSRPSHGVSNNTSQPFASSASSSSQAYPSSSGSSQPYPSSLSQDVESMSNSMNFPSFDSNSGLGGFSSYHGPNVNSSLSSGLLGHSLGSDIGMGGSAFRAHQSPANPQPFRLDGTGGISSMGNSGLNYNSSMSAFSSPSGLGSAGGYGNASSFGGFGSGYGGGSTLPFSSAPIMPPPQSMMGYSQTPLGYPGMSPLMMGGPAPPGPPPMGSPMWPMMPSSMMGGGYGYPPHPSSMGFSSSIDGQGFGHLAPGPNN